MVIGGEKSSWCRWVYIDMCVILCFFFFKQKTAYEITVWLEFRRVLFRSVLKCWSLRWCASSLKFLKQPITVHYSIYLSQPITGIYWFRLVITKVFFSYVSYALFIMISISLPDMIEVVAKFSFQLHRSAIVLLVCFW